jgi:hypothetical protein
MENVTITDEYILRYLLGELAEAERSGIEQAFISDPRVHTQVSEVENDLIDDFVRGRLAPHRRRRFEQSYLANPNNRRRVQIAEVIAAAFDRIAVASASDGIVEKPSWRRRLFAPISIPRLAFGLATAAAMFALFLGGYWLVAEKNRLSQEAISTRTDSERRERELEQQIADEKRRNSELAGEIERLRNQPPPQTTSPPQTASPKFASLLLFGGTLRDNAATEATTLSITPDKTQVRLTFKMEDGGYPAYRAEIQGPSDEIIWSRGNLKPALNQSIAVFNIILPSDKFSSGTHILTISGVNRNGSIDTLSKSNFRVEKNF